jgi:hypothetical protein
MKGDFTRSTFEKEKHYRKVNMQQGRVQVDADWNEQNDIQSHHEQTFLRDLIGRSGTLEEDDGFRISENFSFIWDDDYPDDSEAAALGSFLRDSLGLLWIAKTEIPTTITKSADGNKITISAPDGSHSATITRNSEKPVLAIDNIPVYEFLYLDSESKVLSPGYTIGRGDYYVDGILCENEKNVEASRQPDILAQQVRFQIFDWDSATSDPVKNAIAGFVSAMFPTIAGPLTPLTVEKTSSTLIKITNPLTSDTAKIELTGDGKCLLKFGDSEVPLVAEGIDGKTLIYHPVENPSLPTRPSETDEDGDTSAFYLAYLDVWDQQVTHLEDAYIREKALGGVDTATRTRTAWQVKLLPWEQTDEDGSAENVDKCSAWQIIDINFGQLDLGKMQARAAPTNEETDMCKLYETAGYRGLENHLYRVEVHKGGSTLADSTFKWSRDNGIVASIITNFSELDAQIEIQRRGRDDNLDFNQDTWIEITDDLHERLGLPGTLVKVKEVKETTIKYYSDTVIGHPITADNFTQNPKARRWDSNGVFNFNSADVSDYVELEDGVQVKLSEGRYRTGDYWLIPARANSEESIEWPRIGNKITDAPQALLPSGVTHHYAPLAIVQHDKNDGKFTVKYDARSFFLSLADLMLVHYTGGDGQEALPDNSLAEPLRVAVTLGNTRISKTPIGSAKVRFTIVKPSPPGGILTAGGISDSSSLEVQTNSETGIAECLWTLADGVVEQQVRAELVECGDALDELILTKVPPIYFGATQPIWFYYVAGDGAEEKAGQTIELSAGVAVGTRPATDNYKVRFSVVQGKGTPSNLSNPEPSLVDGIATTTYTLSASPKRQQIKAELLFDDNNPTNFQPIYFNVALAEQETSANTGLLNLIIPEVPEGQDQSLLVYGPFEHNLSNLEVPPAIMLGLASQDNDTGVRYMEDYDLVTKTGVHFKAVEITPKEFKVILRLDSPDPDQPVNKKCIDFRESQPQNPTNPLREQGVSFAIHEANGDLLDPSKLFSFWGQIPGLNCGFMNEIQLPKLRNSASASWVQLILSIGIESNEAMTLLAKNAAGDIVDKKEVIPLRGSIDNPQIIISTLRGEGIAFVVVDAPSNTALLHKICYGNMLLRWWAVPAQKRETRSGEPILETLERKLEFDKEKYSVGDTAIVKVTDLNLRPPGNIPETVTVLITTQYGSNDMQAAKIPLRETEIPNVYVTSFEINEGFILLDNEVRFDVAGLKSGALMTAIYAHDEQSKPVTDEAQIQFPVD